MANENIVVKNTSKALYTGFWVLLVVLLLTLWLFFYSGNIESENANKRENLQNLEREISKLKEDKNIMIYELLKVNESNIKDMEKASNIPNIYSNMIKIGQDFGVSFSEFRYNNETIKAKAFAKSINGKYPYEVASDFIKAFRDENNYIFELETVKAVETTSGANFELTLKLK